MSQRQRRPFWLGVVFVAVMVQLLLWNAYVFFRNQSTFPPEETLRRRPYDIGKLLTQNPMGVVKYTFAMYHQLHVLAGKTLVLPERWGNNKVMLERVSRLQVEITTEPFVLPIEVTDRMYASASLYLRYDSGTLLEVFLDPGATRYYLVDRAPAGLAVIMSEAAYRRERAALGKGTTP